MFQTVTLPVQLNNPKFLGEVEDMWNNITATNNKNSKGMVSHTIALQPFPRAFGKASEARGGNAMGLSSNDHDRIVLEIAGIYMNQADDELMLKIGKEFTDRVMAKVNEVVVSFYSRISVLKAEPCQANISPCCRERKVHQSEHITLTL
jgi:hypothetical protein